MGLGGKLYFLLAEILQTGRDLEAGASLLQTDRAISRRFGVSESTARNWRRGSTASISSSTIHQLLQVCSQIAPERLPDLELIGRLSRDIREAGLAASALADELEAQISQNGRDWHIYSGPLLMAFDPKANAEYLRMLMLRSSMIVERLLEMRADSSDIPAIGELIRYSIHGWHAIGLFRMREASLSSRLAGLQASTIGKVETALYIADGLGMASLSLGQVEQAKRYVEHALALLANTDHSEVRSSPVSLEDARILLRSFDASILCYEGYAPNCDAILGFARDYGNISAENEWIESIRQLAFGYISVCQRNFSQAAFHFEQSSGMQDRWLERYNVPFCTVAPHGFHGYALLMTHGPTDKVKLQMSEGLLRSLDHGGVAEQVQARLCLSWFYAAEGNAVLADFHRQKALTVVQHHDLSRWFKLLEIMLRPAEECGSFPQRLLHNAETG